MYPLAIVVGIAAFRRDGGIWRYAVPVAAIGLAISIYHTFMEWFPNLDAGFCTADVPCSAAYVTEFGFVGIPFMAGSGFAIIIVLLLVARYHRATPSPETPV
jgi:disulfide bond formation protein DsbB